MQVEKVSYDINWKAFKRGWSFFIPCLDPVQAKRELLETTDRLRVKVLIKVVIVEGVRGLRVWRM
jgi:hypothetical protein